MIKFVQQYNLLEYILLKFN